MRSGSALPRVPFQYLTSLNGTGLLDSHAIGKKIIYSVNRQRVDSFIAELQKILHGETE